MTDFAAKRATLPSTLVSIAHDAFGEHLSAAVVHGSGHHGRDFVPFWSDFDCHFYLASSVLDESDLERLDRVLRFRRGHAALDPSDYELYYIQIFFLLADFYPARWATPIDGTFEILYGARPAGWDQGDRPDPLTAAASTLADLRGLITRITTEVSDLHRAAFARSVRSLGTFVKPALYSAATLITQDPVATWRSDRDSVLAVVERELPLASAHAFYDRVGRWQAVRDDDTELEAMMRDGVRTLVALNEWHPA